MGGRDTAAQPVEMLLASLVGCTQATALFVARHMTPRLKIEKMKFRIEAERDERGALALPLPDPATAAATQAPVPSRLQRVWGTVTVHHDCAEPIGPDQMRLLKDQTELRCPVANMMHLSGIEMDVDWIDASASSNNEDQ